MKTSYVTVPDEPLKRLIEKYSHASPVDDADDFGVYLSLSELLRLRRPEPRALTLDELRERKGKAVYTVSKISCQWAIIDILPRFNGGEAIKAIYGDRLSLGGDDYGRTWIAYDREPGKDGEPHA